MRDNAGAMDGVEMAVEGEREAWTQPAGKSGGLYRARALEEGMYKWSGKGKERRGVKGYFSAQKRNDLAVSLKKWH